jgi:hypothetical protein
MSKHMFWLCVAVVAAPFVAVAIGTLWLLIEMLGWWTVPVGVWIVAAVAIAPPEPRPCGKRMP